MELDFRGPLMGVEDGRPCPIADLWLSELIISASYPDIILCHQKLLSTCFVCTQVEVGERYGRAYLHSIYNGFI